MLMSPPQSFKLILEVSGVKLNRILDKPEIETLNNSMQCE